jgi:energy-coupling factor transporter ATP-binding protein EcfA2
VRYNVPYVLLLVTGASGAGKSTVRQRIAGDLTPEVECVELADVVEVPRIPTISWRQEATESVVRRALELQQESRHLLLSGDPVAASEVVAAPSADQLEAIGVCLLDISPDAQAARLRERGDDPALLVRHQAFASWMRDQSRDPGHMLDVITTGGWEGMRWERLHAINRDEGDWRIHVVDVSRLARDEVAAAVLEWARRSISERLRRSPGSIGR